LKNEVCVLSYNEDVWLLTQEPVEKAIHIHFSKHVCGTGDIKPINMATGIIGRLRDRALSKNGENRTINK